MTQTAQGLQPVSCYSPHVPTQPKSADRERLPRHSSLIRGTKAGDRERLQSPPFHAFGVTSSSRFQRDSSTTHHPQPTPRYMRGSISLFFFGYNGFKDKNSGGNRADQAPDDHCPNNFFPGHGIEIINTC